MLEHCWKRTESESSMSKSHIWDSIMAIRVAKHDYFSALVMSADTHPISLFKVTCFLLGKDEPFNYLEGGVRNCIWHVKSFRFTQR